MLKQIIRNYAPKDYHSQLISFVDMVKTGSRVFSWIEKAHAEKVSLPRTMAHVTNFVSHYEIWAKLVKDLCVTQEARRFWGVVSHLTKEEAPFLVSDALKIASLCYKKRAAHLKIAAYAFDFFIHARKGSKFKSSLSLLSLGGMLLRKP